jgi:hypothetical protein
VFPNFCGLPSIAWAARASILYFVWEAPAKRILTYLRIRGVFVCSWGACVGGLWYEYIGRSIPKFLCTPVCCVSRWIIFKPFSLFVGQCGSARVMFVRDSLSTGGVVQGTRLRTTSYARIPLIMCHRRPRSSPIQCTP